MEFIVLSLFPEALSSYFKSSIIGRAVRQKRIKLRFINFRDFAHDKHRTVDDKSFGGGVGMVLKIEPIYKALQSFRKKDKKQRVVLFTPQGGMFNQKTARRLSKYGRLVFICGHYEGVDERVGEYLADEQISIGDYILTGGELPALVVIDAVTRLLPGVLSKKEATCNESFQTHKKIASEKSKFQIPNSKFQLLEPPQYTRPADFAGMKVPPVLLSGNHPKIREWRLKEAWKKTRQRRPDLLYSKGLERPAGPLTTSTTY